MDAGSRGTTAHAHQCCRFQGYPKAIPSRMKLTMREPASMTTDKGSRRVTSYFYSALLWNREFKTLEFVRKWNPDVVGNSRAFLLSYLPRSTEVHTPLTQIYIHVCGTVLIVAGSASLTNDSNLSHFIFKSHNYSAPLQWILPTLWCK